jgi:hypothetical protein
LSTALLLGATLAVVCVVLVALPFLRDPDPDLDELEELTPERRQRLQLAEERDRALAALKELEADHRSGSITDQDYRASIGPLRREAAAALRALDDDRGKVSASSPRIEPHGPADGAPDRRARDDVPPGGIGRG